MEEKRYIFNAPARLKRGVITMITNIWAWSVLLVGLYYSYSNDPVGTIVILFGITIMIIVFFIGFFSGTSLVFSAMEVSVHDKKKGWIAFPYNQYRIELSEQRHSINLFTLYVKRNIFFYSLTENRLVHAANVFNIPSREFKKLKWMIRDSTVSAELRV